MKKHIIKDTGVSKGDITHVDQEIKGLQFSCFHLANGKVIVTVTGDEAKIDEWSARFGIDVSEMTASEYDTLTKAETKEALKSEISELDKELKEKKDKLALLE